MQALEQLQSEYQTRQKRNPRYSLRAFAKAIGLAPGTLSEIFSGKRALTTVLGARIANKLGWSENETQKFLRLVGDNQVLERRIRKMRSPDGEPQFPVLAEDYFALIADWYHFALLSLSETNDFKGEPKTIARRLQISVAEAKAAIARLYRMGLIEAHSTRGFAPTKAKLTTSHDIPSAAVKKFHHQSLSRSLQMLSEIPVDYRDITSMTMAIDPSKLKLAKELIKNFRRQIAELLEKGNRTEVFQLNVQLVPLTRKMK